MSGNTLFWIILLIAVWIVALLDGGLIPILVAILATYVFIKSAREGY